MDRKNEIKELVTAMYFRHDLNPQSFKKSIEELTELVWNNVKDFPELKVTKYTVIQIVLENFNTH